MHDELQFIWDVSPVGLAKVSRGGKFLAVSPQFAEMVGYSETELLARTYQQITHPDDLAPDTTEANYLAENPEHRSYQMVKRYISKDGRSVWANIYVHAICDTGNTFSQFFVFAAELSPVTLYSGNTSAEKNQFSRQVSVWKYIKENPREAIIVISMIVALSKGGTLMQLMELMIKK